MALTCLGFAGEVHAVLIESWENSANGWTISAENSADSISGFSNFGGLDKSNAADLPGWWRLYAAQRDVLR
jgi:hypothetical protein